MENGENTNRKLSAIHFQGSRYTLPNEILKLIFGRGHSSSCRYLLVVHKKLQTCLNLVKEKGQESTKAIGIGVTASCVFG